MSAAFVLLGIVTGALFVAIALRTTRFTQQMLVAGLIVAAVNYLLFALAGGASSGWLAAETIGIAIYGAFAILAVRGSAWWLAVGWSLHPLWDIGLHLYGGGRAFAPANYVSWCLSLDLVVGAALATRLVLASRRALVTEPLQ